MKRKREALVSEYITDALLMLMKKKTIRTYLSRKFVKKPV